MRLQAYVYLGWSPILAVASDGARRVLQVVGWEGGTGTAPATGLYVGASGYVSNIADGVDIAGGAGGGGAAISGGTNSQNTGTVNFSNSNGVSFGLNTNGVMTATVATNYQSQGAYLTTAMLSNAGSNFVGLNSALTGNGVSATINSSGISLNVPAFLTTAQPVGAYLTTARASNDAIGLNSALTANGVSVTANSSGLSLNFPAFLTTAQPVGAYLTTAMLSNAATISNIKVSAGTLSALRSDLSFNNGNGVTFGLETNGIITASVAAAGGAQTGVSGISAGTTQMTSGTLSIADGGGVSFGMNGNTLTATVRTDYQSAGAYLTTAMASNRGSDFVQATAAFAGTNASGTIASNGISVSVNAQSAVPQNVSLYALGNTTQNSSTQLSVNALSFNAIGSITMGYSNGSIQVSAPNALTTAMASNRGSDFMGTNTAITANGVSMTANSSGLSLNFPAFLTTAALSNHSHNFATTTTNGALIVVGTTNSAGATIGVPAFLTTAQAPGAYLTTARASNDAIGLNTALTANGVAWTVNSSGLSLNIPAFLTTAAQSSVSNVSGIIAGTNATGGTATLSGNVSFSNANGISFFTSAGNAIVATVATNYQSQGAYLTTAMQTGSQSQLWVMGNSSATVGGTNISGTMYSNGLSLSVAAPGGGGGIAASLSGNSTSGGAGYSNITSGTMILAGGPNITLSQDGSRISISANNPGAAAENNYINLLGANTAGNTTASGSTIGWSGQGVTLSGTNGSQVVISAPATSSISGTGQVSISVNGSTISIGVPNALTVSRYNEFKESPLVAGNIGQASLHVQPWLIPNLQFDRIVVHKIFSNATNSSGSFTVSDWVGIYTQNVSTLSLLHSASYSTNFSGSGTVGSYLSYGGGIKAITMGLTQTLTEGMYWIGVINRTTTGGAAGHTLNQALNSNVNTSYLGIMGAATNATNQMSLGFGAYTATTTAMPASIAFTQINGNSSVFLRPPSLYFVSGTI